MFCQSSVIAHIGGFDAKYFLYFEDFDLSIRVREHSRIAHVPSVRIKHYGGNTGNKGIRHIMLFMFSAVRFFSAHGWRWY
jgi:GT2 family glycosyltransferase